MQTYPVFFIIKLFYSSIPPLFLGAVRTHPVYCYIKLLYSFNSPFPENSQTRLVYYNIKLFDLSYSPFLGHFTYLTPLSGGLHRPIRSFTLSNYYAYPTLFFWGAVQTYAVYSFQITFFVCSPFGSCSDLYGLLQFKMIYARLILYSHLYSIAPLSRCCSDVYGLSTAQTYTVYYFSSYS